MTIPPQTKAFLFDMDGVLVNTEDIAHDLFVEFALKFHSDFTEDDHKHILGTTESFWSEYLCKKWNAPISAEQFAIEYWMRWDIFSDSKIDLMLGVRQLFASLKESGYKIALVTSTPREHAVKDLGRFNILSYFDESVTGDEITNGKPHPEPYLKAIHALGVSADECVVVEDAVGGVKSGKAAGCFVVAVPTKHAEGLDYSEADVVLSSLEEIKV